MSATSRLILVADIGGTNARFALARAAGGGIKVDRPSVLQTSDYPTLEKALGVFLADKSARVDMVSVCAAGPVTGEGANAHIHMTNCPWDVSVRVLTSATDVAHPVLMNDFAALARAVPELKPDDLHAIGGGAGEPHAPIGILGAGTGLGVAALVPDPAGGYIAVPGEGGHVDLAPGNAREMAVLARLMERHGHVSVERVLSGPGLVALYETLCALDGAAAEVGMTGVGITGLAEANASPLAREAVALFTGWLGAVAGNLALTLGAEAKTRTKKIEIKSEG
mgnify:CR=1 FL=1